MNRQQFLLSILAIPALAKLPIEIDIDILTGQIAPVLRFGLQKEPSKSFEAMKKEAAKAKIKLHITSGYRSYNKQIEIWNGKYDRYSSKGLKGISLIKKITEFSAMPGTSRHHWGTDADILDISVLQPKNPLEPSHYVSSKGIYNRLYEWMLHNSERFGFYEAYTDDPTRTGYEFEPWHYSYKTLAIRYLKDYNRNVKLSYIKLPQLKGKELITEAFFSEYKRDYVNGLNPYLQ
ncbi:MAG: M15 family metallopeptidase [Opitutaceae bacterium]|nr:M15 family metallopeptidase [Cytophagales bacterium]